MKGDPYTQSPMEPARAGTESRDDRYDELQGEDGGGFGTAEDPQMRIVQAQEAERSRLAQEIHDGPAQALSNAIFQVEYIERVIDFDPLPRSHGAALPARAAATRVGDVRGVHQPAPAASRLTSSASTGAIMDTIQHTPGRHRAADRGRADAHRPTASTTASKRSRCAWPRRRCRIPASTPPPASAIVTTASTVPDWVLEVSDDGRGFDVQAVRRPAAAATSDSSSCESVPS